MKILYFLCSALIFLACNESSFNKSQSYAHSVCIAPNIILKTNYTIHFDSIIKYGFKYNWHSTKIGKDSIISIITTEIVIDRNKANQLIVSWSDTSGSFKFENKNFDSNRKVGLINHIAPAMWGLHFIDSLTIDGQWYARFETLDKRRHIATILPNNYTVVLEYPKELMPDGQINFRIKECECPNFFEGKKVKVLSYYDNAFE